MTFKEELENNKNVGNADYVDLDYAMERLEDEGKSHILRNIPTDPKITNMEDYISTDYLITSLTNEETSKYKVMGD